MPTYPLDFPTVSVTNSSFRLVNVVSENISAFTGKRQAYLYPAEWWEGEITFKPTNHVQAGQIKAFLAELRGKYGTFLYGDPDNLAKGNNGAGGTLLVNGASQTGNTLIVDGGTPSATVAKKGDFFQLGTGSTAQLYMHTKDLVLNGSGQGTAEFAPRLRSSPANNAALTLSSPKGVFQSVENSAEWQTDNNSIYAITIAFREVIG